MDSSVGLCDKCGEPISYETGWEEHLIGDADDNVQLMLCHSCGDALIALTKEWLAKDAPHECEYGMPVIAEDGSYTWTCPVCGDTQTNSKDLHDRIMADGMRIFREVREKQEAAHGG